MINTKNHSRRKIIKTMIKHIKIIIKVYKLMICHYKDNNKNNNTIRIMTIIKQMYKMAKKITMKNKITNKIIK